MDVAEELGRHGGDPVVAVDEAEVRLTGKTLANAVSPTRGQP